MSQLHVTANHFACYHDVESHFELDDPVISGFLMQKQQLLATVRELGAGATIGTLGPSTTTSAFALKYFRDYLAHIGHAGDLVPALRDTFDAVVQDLKSGTTQLILIPNAYPKITDIYWDIDIKNVFSFLLTTPCYGLAIRTGARCEPGRKLVIASCRPVFGLVPSLLANVDPRPTDYSILQVESTAAAARAVRAGEADLAVTNIPNVKDEGLELVSKLYNAEVLWSVFARRREWKECSRACLE